MEEEITRLIHLIQAILEMTTLDSGRAVTTWEPVSLFYIIENIVTRYQSRAEASGLTLVVKPAPPDLPVVKGDQARLSQALEEIVENAIIFTPAGGQVTVETGTAEDEGSLWVTIIVRDTGPGIPPEEQDKVFDRFFRGSLAESGHTPGTGLGLSIADEIAVDRFLNGNIGFLDIPRLLDDMMARHDRIEEPTIEDIWAVDSLTREAAQKWGTS